MKILLLLFIFVGTAASAQDYATDIGKAEALYKEKQYAAALPVFRQALADTSSAQPYDLYYGAKTAAASGQAELALTWLGIAQRKGLGLGEGEAAAIQNDPVLAPLHQLAGWSELGTAFESALSRKKTAEQQRAADWLKTISQNRITVHKGKGSPLAPLGFALYFSTADTVQVPYLVYVPKKYTAGAPLKTIVYLHGGVNNYSNFDYKNPDNAQEPIFAAADSIGALVIYPFGRKTFGWMDQPAAFRQVLTILKETEERYPVDSKAICLTGMSNGGTACFWFAGQGNPPFRSYLAISAMPVLSIGPVNFSLLNKAHPFYSVNALDDEVFDYKTVRKVYETNKVQAPGWLFDTLQSGGHGFIYGPDGVNLLRRYLSMCFAGN